MNHFYVVTGGTSGIGLSTVKALCHSSDNTIFSISRSQDKINTAKKQVDDLPGTVHFYNGDVSDINSVKHIMKEISLKTNKIDGLVNNAGIIHPGGIESLTFEDWNETIKVNLSSVYAVSQTALPLLKASDASAIVNVSSISSILLGSSVGYSVCKAALDMLTKGLAKELAKYNIRVNSVNPGITKTGFQVTNQLMKQKDYGTFLDDIAKTYPLGLGEPEDVSGLILFLLSEKARWITGSIVIIDGGRVINS